MTTTPSSVHLRYRSMDEVRSANAARGHFFFSPDTMRFFRSRVGATLYGGRYFITSEQNAGPGYTRPRLYTVREAMPDGSINDASDFQQFETADQARRYAEKLAKRLEGGEASDAE